MGIIFEYIFGRFFGQFFGYYTLLGVFKIFNHKKYLQWLKSEKLNEGDDLFRGCFIQIVGIIVFIILALSIGWVFDNFIYEL